MCGVVVLGGEVVLLMECFVGIEVFDVVVGMIIVCVGMLL